MSRAHKLTSTEQLLSEEASKRLGFKVRVYEEDRWICDPADENKVMGFGGTAAEAIEKCYHENVRPS
ncbi:hypothetical protein [Rhizobium ruizarguesonis]|uniref:hypothetical protein n=1 Tax=Rhizobium ruizarguesonis TaxID=2081791 RepID=UPI0013E03016|nr:hypothetical protein [Rhizobium ruizarguesonis]NEJ96033.1 hypothetical protein [Rhizobium ruizarguesonis]